MTVLSVDLASRRYRDNGIAILHGSPGRVRVELISPDALGLNGEPQVEPFADALVALASRQSARILLLDGPQGWRAEQSEFVHQRRCERETLTPGKTGLPGIVKPASWTRMATFSVALFDALAMRGWPRLRDNWQGERVASESFPTHAWRMLRHKALPGKATTTTLEPWRGALADAGILNLPASATHDEIQAVVAGIGGILLLQHGPKACDLRGCNPFTELGTVREGFILSPRL
jgi:hypothetical protein